MGLAQLLAGQRVYLDTNILIYAVEGSPDFARELRSLLIAVDAEALNVVTSEISLAEMLVKPLRWGRLEDADRCRRFLQPSRHFSVEPITREILEECA